MVKFFILGFIILGSYSYGQNLIPNPYFNKVKDCTKPVHEVEFTNWFNITTGYQNKAFHTCLGNTPYRPFGTTQVRYPKRGHGMSSIEIFYDEGLNRRSYLVTTLNKKLFKNNTYYIRFYVSPKKYDKDSRNIVVNAIGMYITEENLNPDMKKMLPYHPQVEHIGNFMDNYDFWYRIQGKYRAKGGEDIAIIGNFREDKNTRFKYNNPSSQSVGNIAEIFIDDVLIEAFDPLRDTILLCDRTSLTLNAGFHEARYQWNTGEQDSVIIVNRSGKYKVSALIDTLEFQDSTEVIFMDEYSQESTIDTFFCEGSDLVLRAPVPGSHQWSTGETTPTLTVRDEGTYRLSVENTCGSYRFTYQVIKQDCNCDLMLPSAFSPNGDHRNDIFSVIDQCRNGNWSMGSFRVYDKWGGMVYQESEQTVSWNGQSSGGKELPPGVYTYRLVAMVREGMGEESIVKTGSVHLLR